MILQHPNLRRHHTKKEQTPVETTKETYLPCADIDDYFDDEFHINIPQAHNYQTSLHSKQRHFNQVKGIPGIGILLDLL